MEAEIGWMLPRHWRYCDIIRLRHRLANMDANRLTHKVFLWDLHMTDRYRNTWCVDVRTIFQDWDMINFFNIELSKTISFKNIVEKVRLKLKYIREHQWNESVLQSAKLRTYRTFKSAIFKERYVDRFLPVQQRSALARFRCGSFPLAIELGRYRRPAIPLEQRICRVCYSPRTANLSCLQ